MTRQGDAVIVVSSHVVRGSVGNRAMVPALEALGLTVWAVPTVTLAWHPGHGPATRIVADGDAFAGLIGDLCRAPWLAEVAAVASGYLGNAAQAAEVARLVAAVRAARPDAVYLCDPVIGDEGGLYVPANTAIAIRDTLLPLANLATPNRFELEWLVDRALPDNAALEDAARSLAIANVVVTSAFAEEGIGNLLVGTGEARLIGHERAKHPPHGTGDLLAATLLGRIVKGEPPHEALRGATASVLAAVTRAVAAGADELLPTTGTPGA